MGNQYQARKKRIDLKAQVDRQQATKGTRCEEKRSEDPKKRGWGYNCHISS